MKTEIFEPHRNDAIQILEGAIIDYETNIMGWHPGYMALDNEFLPCAATSRYATSVCAYGSLVRQANLKGMGFAALDTAATVVTECIQHGGENDRITAWNDKMNHGEAKPKIVAVFRDAIYRLKNLRIKE